MAGPVRPRSTDPDEPRYTLESRPHVLPGLATVAGGGTGVVGGFRVPGATPIRLPLCTADRP